jgi:hypothetical protein
MSDHRNRTAIAALGAAINAKNVDAFANHFTEDAVIEWPQSGERILGRANLHAIYSRAPGLPTVTPRALTGSGTVWVLEAALDYGDGDPYQCVFLFEMRDGLIAKETAYWSKPFPAPEWRAPWVSLAPSSGSPA